MVHLMFKQTRVENTCCVFPHFETFQRVLILGGEEEDLWILKGEQTTLFGKENILRYCDDVDDNDDDNCDLQFCELGQESRQSYYHC